MHWVQSKQFARIICDTKLAANSGLSAKWLGAVGSDWKPLVPHKAVDTVHTTCSLRATLKVVRNPWWFVRLLGT